MNTIKNILNEYSNRKLYQNANLSNYIKISQKWNDIMGEVLSKICYPSFYKNGTLIITVRDNVWANEIIMNKLNIFNNIKKETFIAVNDIRTKIGNINNDIQLNNNSKEIIDKIVTKDHKKWINDIIEASQIKDERMKDIFYNILKNENYND